jgi:predicted hotdog family 3-hydroxylacyl-ACP dehydratase
MPDTGIIEKEELQSILPHQGKMLLISRVLEYDIDSRALTSEYDITEDCLFYDPLLEGVPSWACFEFMAQGVSAISGLVGRAMGKPPMLGFILSVSSLKTNIPLIKAGSVIRVRVTEDVRVDNVFTFHCVVLIGETQAAEAKLTVMDVEDSSVFMEKENYGK